MYKSILFRSIISGAVAGLANGLFGAGGGMVLVPLLIHWVNLDDKDAFSSSVAIIFPICLISAAVYWKFSFIDLPTALPYLLGGLIGGFIGGKIFHRVSPLFLHKVFGLIVLWGGIRNLWT